MLSCIFVSGETRDFTVDRGLRVYGVRVPFPSTVVLEPCPSPWKICESWRSKPVNRDCPVSATAYPMWIMGPSGPTGSPAPTAHEHEKNLTQMAGRLSTCRITVPFRNPITSGMPEPPASWQMNCTSPIAHATINRPRRVHAVRRCGPLLLRPRYIGSAEYCDKRVCLCVCVFVCPRSYLWNSTFNRHQIFCARYLWPWLDPLLAAQWYVTYFRFCGWRHICI